MKTEDMKVLMAEVRIQLGRNEVALRRLLSDTEEALARLDGLAKRLDAPETAPEMMTESWDRLAAREAAYREARRNGIPLGAAQAEYVADAKAEREDYMRRMGAK